MRKKSVGDYLLELLFAGCLAPFVFGIITGILFNDFASGAGFGAFLMIGSWIFILIYLIFKI